MVFKRVSIFIVCVVSLSACAHHHAARVDCKGPLRPINRPAPLQGGTGLPPTSSDSQPAAAADERAHAR
jgi:hypothetical protein